MEPLLVLRKLQARVKALLLMWRWTLRCNIIGSLLRITCIIVGKHSFMIKILVLGFVGLVTRRRCGLGLLPGRLVSSGVGTLKTWVLGMRIVRSCVLNVALIRSVISSDYYSLLLLLFGG